MTSKNLITVLDESLYIFVKATEQEIVNTLPRNWSDNKKFYVNLTSAEEVELVEKNWKKLKK